MLYAARFSTRIKWRHRLWFVDAKNEGARNFYLHHEFIALATQPNRLSYPMKAVALLFGTRET
jgi:hypothetical protein